MQGKKILFLNLTAFSKTGGIEKFNKALLMALSEFERNHFLSIRSYSLFDKEANEQYFLKQNYKGFSGKKNQFIAKSIYKSKDFDLIILGHINLAIIGCFIKILFPRKKIILITHGIEVWKPLKGFKKLLLKKADLILAVSNFTRNKIIEVQKINEKKVRLFYNTIDPYFIPPSTFTKGEELRKKYDLSANDFILFTLTRLSSAEKYKGYDVVIQCLPELLKKIPQLKYIIGGKYDEKEKERIDNLVRNLHLENAVVLKGQLKDSEVKAYFQMSDLFIMPSKGEGFGIVFIEALVCGLPVIAGNLDGSVDAVQNGKLGTLVNPLNPAEISEAIFKHYSNHENITAEQKYQLQKNTLKYFHFDQYKRRLENILLDN